MTPSSVDVTWPLQRATWSPAPALVASPCACSAAPTRSLRALLARWCEAWSRRATRCAGGRTLLTRRAPPSARAIAHARLAREDLLLVGLVLVLLGVDDEGVGGGRRRHAEEEHDEARGDAHDRDHDLEEV